jgi:O-methyltransferase
MTLHVADFCKDRRFISAYERGKATGSWNGSDLRWRVYVACWAAERARALVGDFVECGVNRGGMSLAVMEYIGFKDINKRFFLLDTYRGFPENLRPLAASVNRGHYQECYEEVAKTFATFDNVRIVRGSVPETLSQVETDHICYLSLDMNCAEPEIAAMRYFWTKLVAGAVVLLDDYAFSESYRRQKDAFDSLSRELKFTILSLPTGQGLVLKA